MSKITMSHARTERIEAHRRLAETATGGVFPDVREPIRYDSESGYIWMNDGDAMLDGPVERDLGCFIAANSPAVIEAMCDVVEAAEFYCCGTDNYCEDVAYRALVAALDRLFATDFGGGK